MLDKAIRLVVTLTITVMIAQWSISLAVQALRQLLHGLFAGVSWLTHGLLLIALVVFAAGVGVRAVRSVTHAWRQGLGEERRRVSVRRRAEEPREEREAPPPDEADPPVVDEDER